MKKNQWLDDLARFVGLLAISIIAACILVAVVYGLLGYFEGNVWRWLATVLIFGLLGAFVLGLQIGKAHVKGVERGLDIKIGAKERAAARPVPAQPSTAQRYDDLLPKVSPSAAIVMRQDSDTTPIEM